MPKEVAQTMTIERALKAVENYLKAFKAQGWYGTVEVKVENGHIRHVQANAVMRQQ